MARSSGKQQQASTYRRKRNFRESPEPSWPSQPRRKKAGRARAFVIQKHKATRLHYDLRLEIAGALASWAVPKGLPFKKGEKNLAIKVEDHPLDYGEFEGVIPEGNYGAGTVMLWDRGSYEVEGDDPQAALDQGKIVVHFRGEKIKGTWTLVHTRSGDKEKENWLLLKSRENTRPVTKKEDDRSVGSGRTLRQIADQENSGDHERSESAEKELRRLLRQKSFQSLSKGKAEFVPVMKPHLSSELPATPEEWLYEIKFDGYRAIMVKNGNNVEFYSRNHKRITGDYPEVCDAFADLPVREAVVDGEMVALDKNGVSSFQLLQNRGKPGTADAPPLFCYAFDLLRLEGRNTTGLPLEKRQELLASLLSGRADPLRLSRSIRADPEAFLQQARDLGLEGIIAKKPGSSYHSGKRSRDWLKIKVVHQQEFVVGGYTPPQGSRKHFGSILVGYYENKKFVFAGKVGTGFSDKLLEEARKRFDPLKTPESPFEKIPTGRSRWGPGLTPAVLKKTTWLKPKLVCEVKFSEWTGDGILRQPVFLGFRDDKAPTKVKKE